MTETVEPQRPARVDPPLRAGEAETLVAFLDHHRATLRRKVAGLDRGQLGRSLSPSTMTLGGLLKHLTLVEEHWLSVVLLDAPYDEPWASVDWDSDPDWEWQTGSTDEPADLLAAYDATVGRTDANIARCLAADGLETLSAKPSRHHGEGAFSLRWILLHLVEEYARHNGHADLLRESIDGQVVE